MTTTEPTSYVKATIRQTGGPDSGYHVVQCDAAECRDLNGRPWQMMYSRRTAEGADLARRDQAEHNRIRHAAKTLAFDAEACSWYFVEDGRPELPGPTACAFCGHLSGKYRQEQSGHSYTCQRPECGRTLYVSIGD